MLSVKRTRSAWAALLVLMLAGLPCVAFGADACYQYALVDLHRDKPIYESRDTVVVLDVILIPPLNVAYDKPALSNAASAFLKPKLAQLKVKETMTSSKNFSFLSGCAHTKDELEKRRADDLQKFQTELSSDKPGRAKYLEVVHGNWYVEKGEKDAALSGSSFEQGGVTWSGLMPPSGTAMDGVYKDAAAGCSKAINGKTGWRLPTIDELSGLAKAKAADKLGSRVPTKGAKTFVVWSSTVGNKKDSHKVAELSFAGYRNGDFMRSDQSDSAGKEVFYTCVR